MDFKDINKSDPEAVKKSIEEAVAKGFSDIDYWGPIGNGWYQMGHYGYTGKGGWDLLDDAIKEESKKYIDNA